MRGPRVLSEDFLGDLSVEYGAGNLWWKISAGE